ncbi:MAG: glycosyltransferase family 4 protein [Bacteroidetes bacterium]|nr:glycosyltransferase family 4 protein [Bacteroidota bacterium]
MINSNALHKKNILFILQGGRGGTLEYVKYLLKRLNKEKYETAVICHGEAYNELKSLGYNVHAVEMVREISPVRDFLSLMKIIAFLLKNRPDIAYSHSTKAGVLGRLAAGILKISNIYNPHGWSFNMKVSSPKKKLYILVEKIASLFADKIVAISESEYNDALAKKITKKRKIVLIKNGIDLDKFDKRDGQCFKRFLNIPDDYKVIGMVGRLTRQKSPQAFVEIARLVHGQCLRCVFILVGDGGLREEVEKMIRKYNLENNFIITGWVENPERYISVMDVGVLTSQWEGFGLVLVEMMACGKPVVASNVDGIPYVVRDKVDGFLCQPDDVQEFAGCILKLLHNNDLYESMSDSACRHARDKFDLKRVIEQHEKLFNSLPNDL